MVEGLVKHFGIRAGLLQRQVAAVQVLSPGWLSVRVLAWMSTISAAVGAAVLWLNAADFGPFLSPETGRRMTLAAVAVAICGGVFLVVALAQQGGKRVIRVSRRAGRDEPPQGVTVATMPVAAGPIRLRIHARGGRYDFDYAVKAQSWQSAARDVDGTNLSTAKAGGFVGGKVGHDKVDPIEDKLHGFVDKAAGKDGAVPPAPPAAQPPTAPPATGPTPPPGSPNPPPAAGV